MFCTLIESLLVYNLENFHFIETTVWKQHIFLMLSMLLHTAKKSVQFNGLILLIMWKLFWKSGQVTFLITGFSGPSESLKVLNISGLFFFFKNIGIHSIQGWTATARHWVTRKRSTKWLKHTGNLFKKNLQLIGVS